jgi:glycosyltransferase involved in cell wall biosynthesis
VKTNFKLSIISPVYRNEDSLEELVRRCFAEAEQHYAEVEYILVNDGSPDGSLAILRRLAEKDHRIKVVSLARNFGQHTAMMAGFGYCTGDHVFLIDADLEEDPTYLRLLLEEMQKGYEIVVGTRANRRHSFFRRWAAKAYTYLYRILCEDPVLDNVTNMRLMTGKYVKYLLAFTERPFVGGFTAWLGMPIGQVPVHWMDRTRKSGFTLRKLFGHARAGIIGFSSRLLRLASVFGLMVSVVAFLFLFFLLAMYLLNGRAVPGYYSITGFLALATGIQCIFLGIIGEYIGEIFERVKNRPNFLIYETINIDSSCVE